MSFSENLYELRKKKGLSQEELAEKLNVSRQTVSKWETGQTTPEMEKLIILSKLFDVSLDELTENSKTHKSNQESFSKTQNKHMVLKLVVIILIIYLVVSIYKFIALTIMNNIASSFNEISYSIMMEYASNDLVDTPRNYILKINDKIIEKSYSNNQDKPYRIEYIDLAKKERCEIALEDGKYVLLGDTKSIGTQKDIDEYFESYKNNNFFKDYAQNYKYSFLDKLKMAFSPFSVVNIFDKRVTILDPFNAIGTYEYNNDYLLNHTVIKNLKTGKTYESTISYDYVQDHFKSTEIENPLESKEFNIDIEE